MSYKVFARTFRTSELSDNSACVKFTTSRDLVLKAVRAWILFYNNPTFTDISLKLFSNSNRVPGSLIDTSLARTKASLNLSTANLIDIPFEFSQPPLKASDTYFLVLAASGYTEGANSLIGWKHDYPAPVYASGLPTSLESIAIQPLAFTIVDAETLI